MVNKKVKEIKEYKGWLVSPSLIKRSFGVIGHQLLASLIIYGVLLVIIFILAFIFGFASGFMKGFTGAL